MKFETYVTTQIEGTIGSYSVASIIQKERERLLGHKDRFIRDGVIRETDYRFNGSEEVRKATEEEIKMYEAMLLVEKHFKSLD